MRLIPFLTFLLLLLLAAPSLRADPAASKTEARRHFKAGVTLVTTGDLLGAVEAFEAAYATSPHYGVLYNLGQAYAALGRSVQAIQTFERFLKDGGEDIRPSRREQVRTLIARERARLGRVELDISPPGAEAFLDGKTLGQGPFGGLELSAGQHVIGARMAGYLPRAEALEISPGGNVRLTLSLEREERAQEFGFLGVTCRVPSVEVWIDGTRQATTPVSGPLVVPAGTRVVRFEREGYVTATSSTSIQVGRITPFDCTLARDPNLANSGTLKVSVSPPSARVTVDGDPYRGIRLPAGPHVVRVEREGFRSWQSIVRVEPKRERQVRVDLEETETRIREREAALWRRRTRAVAVGIGGLALAGGAAVIHAWNSSRYDDWRRKTDALDADLASGSAPPGSVMRAGELRNDAADIQRVNDIALGMAVTAGAALVVSGIVWATSL
jgi:hypothetical protein